MSQLIEKKAGIFNNAQRFAVTNILDEDMNFMWGGNPFSIPAHKTVSLPIYLANSVVDQLVDKILMDEMKANELAYYEKNPNTEVNRYRAPNFLSNVTMRKALEDKIAKPLEMETGSTEAQLLKMQIKEELEHDLKQEVSTSPVSVPMSAVGSFSQDSMKEFAELGKEEEKEVKKPLKVKQIK